MGDIDPVTEVDADGAAEDDSAGVTEGTAELEGEASTEEEALSVKEAELDGEAAADKVNAADPEGVVAVDNVGTTEPEVDGDGTAVDVAAADPEALGVIEDVCVAELDGETVEDGCPLPGQITDAKSRHRSAPEKNDVLCACILSQCSSIVQWTVGVHRLGRRRCFRTQGGQEIRRGKVEVLQCGVFRTQRHQLILLVWVDF